MTPKMFLIFNLMVFSQSDPIPIDSPEGLTLLEVPFGKTVVLRCLSNDERHIFNFWHVTKGNYIIGPSNTNYDVRKYKYEVLSGNLTIKGVTKQDEGLYNCVSEGVKGENVNIKSSKLVVQKDWEAIYEDVNAFMILLIIAITTVLGVGCFLVYIIWKDRFKYLDYLEGNDDTTKKICRAAKIENVRDKDKNFENLATGLNIDCKCILDNFRK